MRTHTHTNKLYIYNLMVSTNRNENSHKKWIWPKIIMDMICIVVTITFHVDSLKSTHFKIYFVYFSLTCIVTWFSNEWNTDRWDIFKFDFSSNLIELKLCVQIRLWEFYAVENSLGHHHPFEYFHFQLYIWQKGMIMVATKCAKLNVHR